MRRGLRWLAGFAALVVALALVAAALAWALSHGWQRERLRAWLAARLAAEIDAPVALESLEGPLVPELALKGLALGPPADRWLEVERIEVRIDPWSLLAGELRVERLEIAHPVLRARRDADGRWNLPAGGPAQGEPTEGGALALALERAVVRSGALEIEWDEGGQRRRVAGGVEAELESLRLPAPSWAGASGWLRIALEPGSLGAVALQGGRLDLRLDAGRLRVEALELAAGGHALALAEPVALRLAGGAVAFERPAVLRGDLGRVSLEGSLGPAGSEGLALTLRDFDVAALAPLVDPQLAPGGRIEADATLSGPWTGLRGRAQLTWSAARIGGARADRVEARVEASAQRVVARLDVRAEGVEALHGEAELPWEALAAAASPLAHPGARLALRASGLELALLQPLLRGALRDLRGRLRADVTLRGGSPPQASGEVAIEQAGATLASGVRVEPVDARAVLRPDPRGIDVASLRAEWRGEVLEGHGVFGPEALHGGSLVLEASDAAGLAALLPGDVALGGTVSARLSAEGPYARPQLAGSLDWAQPRVGSARADRVTLEGRVEGEIAHAELHVRSGERDVLVARGAGPWSALLAQPPQLAPGGSLEVEAQGFDLSALDPFLRRPLRAVRGRADLKLTLEGRDAPRPHAQGVLLLRDGAAEVPLLGQTYGPIDAAVRLGDRELVVESLRIGSPEAGAEIEGRVDLSDLAHASADLSAAMHGFPVARSALLSANLDGDLHLGGTLAAPELRGRLRVDDLRATIPEPSSPALREIRIIAGEAARGGAGALREGPPRAPDAFDRARMALRVEVPRNSWIRGRGLELDLEGALDVSRAPREPVAFAGTVDVLRGRYLFYGKRFDVRSGTATFDGTDRIDPVLEVEADHRVRDVLVHLQLTGRASDPKLKLWSEPQMEEQDVLSYLFFGRLANEAGEVAGFEEAATKLALGVAASQLSSLLETELPIDTLDVRLGESGAPQEITLGKYLTDDFFLSYGRTWGTSPVDHLGVHLRLNEHWSIESDVATDASAGADLIWSTDY